MGHIRLGRLPASRKWKEVVRLLTDGNASFEEIAIISAEAAESALGTLPDDPVFLEIVWLLCKIPQAAQEENFVAALQALGVEVTQNPTLEELIESFSDTIDNCMRGQVKIHNDFGEIARNAAIGSIIAIVQATFPRLRPLTPNDVRHTIARFASPAHFGTLAQEFFSRFTQRHLRYYLDREMPKHIGPGRYLPSLASLDEFNAALRFHCEESSIIMRTFAKDWYGKRYSQKKELTRESVQGFTHITIKTIRNELKQRR